MAKRFPALCALILATVFAVPGRPAPAQTKQTAPATPDLAGALAALDREFFDAYNRCDLEKFASFVAEDVEFYHDKGGVTHGGKALTESVKQNICGKVRRELIAGSLEAHPIPGFGAVQMGSHRFYELAQGPSAGPVGQAKFVSIWRHKDGAWKITRVISYDHVPAPK